MKRLHLFVLLSIIIGISYSACKKEAATPPPFLEIEETDLQVNFANEAAGKSITIQTNVENWSVSSNQDWCTISVENDIEKNIIINVAENETLDIRNATVSVVAGGLMEKIEVAQFGVNPAILLDSKSQSVNFSSQIITVNVTTNADLEISCSQTWIKQHLGTKSAQVDMVDLVYEFEVEGLEDKNSTRYAKIYFQQKGGELKDSVIVTQALTTSDDYDPSSADAFEKDRKIAVLSATLTPSDKYQSGEGIEKSFDGKSSTLYHSPWGGMPDKPVITLEYALDPAEATIANYVILHPRTSQDNGIIKDATIWINTEEDPNYVQVGTVDAPLSNNPVVVRFNTPVINPRNIKVVITDAYSGDPDYYFVSLAEFECYESKAMNSLDNDLHYFTDGTCSELKAGTTMEDIASIENPFLQNIAAYLMAGKYSTEYRVQEFEPYREVGDLARELKTSTYSQFENATGMYFTKDEDVVIFVGPTNGEEISLRVHDFGQSEDDYGYPLTEGVNVLTMKGKGNGYINYYTSNYSTAEKIKIHIASGQVNGYFDVTRHSEEDGKKLLDNAVSEIMDIRGERVNLAYSVNALTQNCYGRVKELINLYDDLIMEEQTMMGLEKYNRLPKNHMFGRVIWNGFMHADGWGAAFHEDVMGDIANPDRLKITNWGVSHEFGHVNQTRPGMNWVGTTEVTNNIFSVWNQYRYNPDQPKLEVEHISGEIGGRVNDYFNNAFINEQEWGLQGGPDDGYGTNDKGEWGADHFVKLVPFWQLQLYYHVAGEGNSWYKPYFWADIFEKVRNTDESNLTHGEFQINFMKNACDAVEQDLSDFFIKIGMLKEVDKMFDDYSSAQKTITQAMVDDVVNYAKQYPKPETDMIHYLSANCVDAYKNKQSISGEFNTGITGTTTKQISHSDWQNVAVFETYKGDELTKITMVGTGSSTNTSTIVSYPSGSTRIEAVGYDGTQVLVFGSR